MKSKSRRDLGFPGRVLGYGAHLGESPHGIGGSRSMLDVVETTKASIVQQSPYGLFGACLGDCSSSEKLEGIGERLISGSRDYSTGAR